VVYLRNKVNDDGKTSSDEFTEEVKKLQESDKTLGFADAADIIAARNPDLYHRYQEDAYSFGGDN